MIKNKFLFRETRKNILYKNLLFDRDFIYRNGINIYSSYLFDQFHVVRSLRKN